MPCSHVSVHAHAHVDAQSRAPVCEGAGCCGRCFFADGLPCDSDPGMEVEIETLLGGQDANARANTRSGSRSRLKSHDQLELNHSGLKNMK